MSEHDAIATVHAARQLTTEAEAEQVADLILRVEALGKIAREARATLHEQLIGWLDANGGSLTVGEVRYYVGAKKKQKLTDKRGALEAALIATGGDLDALADLLAASPFKWAALRGALKGDFVKYTHEEEMPDLKTGKPQRVVKTVNPKMLKGGSA